MNDQWPPALVASYRRMMIERGKSPDFHRCTHDGCQRQDGLNCPSCDEPFCPEHLPSHIVMGVILGLLADHLKINDLRSKGDPTLN